jgi:hypothetical protein
MDLIVLGETLRLSPQDVERSELLRGFAEVMPGEPFTLPAHPKLTLRGVHLFFDMTPTGLDFYPEDFLKRLWAAEILCADVADEKQIINDVIERMEKMSAVALPLRERTEDLRRIYEDGLRVVFPKKRKKKGLQIFQWNLLTAFLPPSFAFKVYPVLYRRAWSAIMKEMLSLQRHARLGFWGAPRVVFHLAYRPNLTAEKTIRRHRENLLSILKPPFYNLSTGRLERCNYYLSFPCQCRTVDHFGADVNLDKWVVRYITEWRSNDNMEDFKKRQYFHETRFDHFQDVWFKSFE